MKKNANFIFAGLLFFLGLLGFVPNPFFSLSGFFKMDVFHNFFHMLCAVAIVVFSIRSQRFAGSVLAFFGYFFLLLSVAGFLFSSNDRLFLILTATTANNWLHLFLGITSLFLAGRLIEQPGPGQPTE